MTLQPLNPAVLLLRVSYGLTCVLLVTSLAYADEIDLNGSWQASATPACGSYISVVQITEDVSTGTFSRITTDCGTVVGTYGIWRLSGCDTDPVAGQVTGSGFAVPPSGMLVGELLFDPPVADPATGCGTTPVSRIVVESRLDGTITEDGGVGLRIDGQATVGISTSYDDQAQTCAVVDYGSVPLCTFIMLRNDVTPGSNVQIEPIEGTSLTFASVIGAGTATITPLTVPDGSLPANFHVLDVPLYFDVTTTATISGTIDVCLPYPDGNDDGIVDGTTPPIDESALLLLHEEGGVFVDRTTTRDTGSNVICAQTSSLSQFIYGAAGSTTTTSTSSTTSTTLPTTDLLPGRIIIIKPGTLANFVAKPATGDTFALPAGNPVTAGGAVRFFDVSATAGDESYALPNSGWKGLGNPAGAKGYKYTGAGTPADPCKVVLLKEKVIKGVCKGSGITLAPPFAGDVGVVLSIGTTDRYCAQFDDTDEAQNDATLTKRKNAPAPGACP